ncbi:MAG: 1-deoxy-D-xylulose-5-phosphate reductoisomerase [Candidatus Micrarchaeota archaeon]
MKHLSILGSTGSIGTQTLDVVRQYPNEFKVEAIASNSNLEVMEQQLLEFKPGVVCIFDEDKADKFRQMVGGETEVLSGMDGLKYCCTTDKVDTVITAVVGAVGLEPTLTSIEAGKNVAVANKETLVAGGDLVMPAVEKHGVTLMPIDSEHSAIFQCLNGEDRKAVEKIIITASGGTFRDWKKEDLTDVTPEQALKHPNWAMGGKITIDSATLMNKALEVIEAHHLYSMPYEKIQAVIHPQSIIHSLVEFADSSIMAQVGIPDMRLPIQYALSYPKRLPNSTLKRLDMTKCKDLTFREIDEGFYPCFKIGINAGKAGGTLPAVMNASNEVAVFAFLEKKIRYLQIPELVAAVVKAHTKESSPSLREILAADKWAREKTNALITAGA